MSNINPEHEPIELKADELIVFIHRTDGTWNYAYAPGVYPFMVSNLLRAVANQIETGDIGDVPGIVDPTKHNGKDPL